ncbi:hypothetical protein [Thioalkalivibrio paradoxus]|uniref:Uncharacterized protein n=1 Tax=Thioalkalivibrio paradoxus ARh 1 TaxID=713585 RepID=W0DSS4_9GAMM|nr:hypothetical protein [Thioalkalivibrio paradoxus]AHE99915.1 hypothetical protein THITH_03675 [Thioalkalivibrio paradoxus ARh 1]
MAPTVRVFASAALSVGILGGISSAQASQLIFPYIVGSATVTTILTVANTTPPGHPGGGDAALHYTYMYKTGATAVMNDALCSRTPTTILSSATNDVQSFDVSGHFGSATRGVLFNDPSNNNNWDSGAQDWASLSGLEPVRAYGVIHNNNDDTGATFPAPYLYGEAFVFEFGSGAAWGYQALEDKGAGGTVDLAPFALGNRLPFTLGVPTGRFTFMPTTEFVTRFFVTPVTTEMANVNAQSRMRVFPWVEDPDVAGYDRDANPIPGFVPQDVTCIGAVDIESMLSSSAATALQHGGWAYLATIPPDSDLPGTVPTVTANVIKLEYNKGATFNGEPIGGVFNNAYQMRGIRGMYPE